MNRPIPKLIFYAVVCHYFITLWSSTSLAAEPKPGEVSNKQEAKKARSEISSSASKSASKRSNDFVLVPPPPPTQPSFLDWSNFSGFTAPFDLFNKIELKQRLAQIQKQIFNAQKNVEENTIQLTEAKDKAEHFDSLYTEGVVSRKELEAAKKSVSDKESSKLEAQGKLADLQIQEKAILRRLTPQKQVVKNGKHSDKSKTIKNEQKQ